MKRSSTTRNAHKTQPQPSKLHSKPQPKQRSNSSALYEVLNVTELLEAILMALPKDRNLLLSQRTCKAFHKTIQGSTLLRRALFLQSSEMDVRRPAANAMLDIVATPSPLVNSPDIFRQSTTIFKVDELKAVFKHNGRLWALTELGWMWTQTSPGPDKGCTRTAKPSKIWRPDNAKFKRTVGWSLIRIANNEVLSCPIFDLASSSLQHMFLTQAPASVTIVLYCGHPDASVLSTGPCQERSRGLSICDPNWEVFGHAAAKFEMEGSTIGEIFSEIDKVNMKYSLYDGEDAAHVQYYVPCGCEKCEARRTPEEKVDKAKAVKKWWASELSWVEVQKQQDKDRE